MARIADQQTDFPQWYLDVIAQADLAEHADVRGCIIFKPYGYALWEAIQHDLNQRIKDLGVDNVYFPLLIPESILQKEKDHIEGFAPECAVVTHGGGKELTEKLYIRPTSETIIYSTFAKWVQSYRDLPLKINQWANVVRWEMRTRPFLRTLEFLWQEGHTMHATKDEADQMVMAALQMYADFDRDMLAIPVVRGKKPEHEKFAGALYTMTTEALARDGKAIQAGTSHNLGQGFSEAYDVKYLSKEGKQERPFMTSWGLSTRIIGTLIVVHGDEKGLRIPPAIAPIQVVIVPIYKSDEEKQAVMKAAIEIERSLDEVRVKLDWRDEKSPGFKFAEWEVKGVPIRIELGPKDLAANQVTMVRRDTSEKSAVPLAQVNGVSVRVLLQKIQDTMLAQAEEFLKAHTHEAATKEELTAIIESDAGGMVWAAWDGDVKTAMTIQNDLKASIRLLGDPAQAKGKKDPFSGKPATEWALYAKAY